jgi:hypothetical protein
VAVQHRFAGEVEAGNRTMRDHGHNVVFATPTARTALADPKMVTGEGLGILSPLLKADANGRSAGAICHGRLDHC